MLDVGATTDSRVPEGCNEDALDGAELEVRTEDSAVLSSTVEDLSDNGTLKAVEENDEANEGIANVVPPCAREEFCAFALD